MVAIVIGPLPNKHITSKQRRMNVDASTFIRRCLTVGVYCTGCTALKTREICVCLFGLLLNVPVNSYGHDSRDD